MRRGEAEEERANLIVCKTNGLCHRGQCPGPWMDTSACAPAYVACVRIITTYHNYHISYIKVTIK